jgi:hypothetical protein
MRNIETKAKEEKRRKKNQVIIGAIMIFIMLGSTFAVIVDSLSNDNANNEKVEYNGYEFVGQNGFWATNIGNYEFLFRYNPTQVERIETEVVYLNAYSGKPLYFSSQSDAASVEIYRNLGNVVQRFQVACIEEEGCPEDWPIRDCSNNFLIIREANESKIYQNENCVFIEGPRENLTQITDEFLFWITGIES